MSFSCWRGQDICPIHEKLYHYIPGHLQVNQPKLPLSSASAKGGLRSFSRANWWGFSRNISRTVAGSCSPPPPPPAGPARLAAAAWLLPGSWMPAKSILGTSTTRWTLPMSFKRSARSSRHWWLKMWDLCAKRASQKQSFLFVTHFFLSLFGV